MMETSWSNADVEERGDHRCGRPAASPTIAAPARGADETGLGDRCVADPFQAKLVDEAGRRSFQVPGHVLAEDEHSLVTPHLLAEGGVDGLQVAHGGQGRPLYRTGMGLVNK